MILTLLIDLEVSEQHKFTRKIQRELMNGFFQNIKAEELDIISHGDQHDDICINWSGLHCEGGVLKSILFQYKPYDNFSLSYTPPTVRQLEVKGCDQCYAVNTREFPQMAELIMLNSNRIHNQIDLTSLPARLRKFWICSNMITGPINLTRLPPLLQHLDLSQNMIEQRVVPFGNLPVALIRVNMNGESMKIRCFQSIDPNEIQRGKSVLTGRKPIVL